MKVNRTQRVELSPEEVRAACVEYVRSRRSGFGAEEASVDVEFDMSCDQDGEQQTFNGAVVVEVLTDEE